MHEPESTLPPSRILIIKPSSLGDLVHALPVLAALREAHPKAHIAWLVNEELADLLEGHPLLDDVIRFDRRRFGRMWRSPRILIDFLQFVGEIRRERFDLVVDLQGLIRSAFLAYASGARQRVGFRTAREFSWLFYSKRVRCPQDVRHAVDRNLLIAASLGIDVDEPRFPLGLRTEELIAAREMLQQSARRAGIAIPLPTDPRSTPFSAGRGGGDESFTAVLPGARWVTKQWKPQRVAALIDRMAAAGMPPCVLLGGPDDRAYAERVFADCETTFVDLVGRTTLRELTAIIALAGRVVSCDSGPMHIAAALNKPLTAIFGPTDPARCGPYSPAARVVHGDVDCLSCYLRTCSHHSCMEYLQVDRVLEEIRRLDDDRGAAPLRVIRAASGS